MALLALMMIMGASSCGDAGDTTYPECIGAVRYGDTTYREIGFTNREGEALQENAVLASCEAVSRDGVSKALSDSDQDVQTLSLPGYPSAHVVLVQATDRAWAVLVSHLARSDDVVRRIEQEGLLNAGEQ